MALGVPEAIAEVAKLLNQVFSYTVSADGYAQLKRENLLKLMMRGADASIAKNDWVTCDALLRQYEQLFQETGP